MHVLHHYRQGLVPADLLDRRHVGSALHQIGDRGMTQHMRGYVLGVEPGPHYRILKRPVHVGSMTPGAVRMRRREDPTRAIVAHRSLAFKDLYEFDGQGLFALSRLS